MRVDCRELCVFLGISCLLALGCTPDSEPIASVDPGPRPLLGRSAPLEPTPSRDVVVPPVVESTRAAAPLTSSAVKPAEDWPCWRGPAHDNLASSARPPLTWSKTEHVLWRTPLPGRAHSSPIVVGDRVYVTTAVEESQTIALVALDRATGQVRWETPLHVGGFVHKHQKNSHASPTPACDGQRIYSTALIKSAIWVTAVDLTGRVVWQVEAGPFQSHHGYGASPIVYRDLVLVCGDGKGEGFVAGLKASDGSRVWSTPRHTGPSHATPLLATLGGSEHLLLCGRDRVDSYDPATGRPRWSVEGSTEETANTMAAGEGLAFASGGWPNAVLEAFDPANGTRKWKREIKVYVPSLLVHAGRLYALGDNGVLRCLDAATGEEKWSKRLGGDFSSSPILAGDAIYATNETGKTYVFRPGDKYEPLAENDLGEPCFATPVPVGERLFLRTGAAVYCLGE